MGHADVEMTLHYTHSDPERRRAAVEAIAGKLVGGEPKSKTTLEALTRIVLGRFRSYNSGSMAMKWFLPIFCLASAVTFAQAPQNPPAPQPGSGGRGGEVTPPKQQPPIQPQPVTLSTPIVTLGAPAVKRGESVTVSIPSVSDVSGATVTLGGRPVEVEAQGKTLLMKVSADQPLGPSPVLVTLPQHRYPAKDMLNVLATATPPAIDAMRLSPPTPQNGRIAVDIFGRGFSTQPETLGQDIQLLLDHSPRQVTWVDKDVLEKQCDDARQKSFATAALTPIYGSVISESQIRVCNIAAESGLLSLGLYQGGDVPSKVDSVVVTNWNVWTIRGVSAGAAIVLVLLVYVLVSFKGMQIVKDRRSRLAAMFVDKQTKTYSLSILQFHMWTAATLFGYMYYALSRLFVQRGGAIADVPGGVPGIVGIGIGAGTAVAAQVIQSVNPKGAGEAEPSPSDLVTSGGAIAPDRVQMLVWTFIAVGMFIAAVLQQDPSMIKGLPEIPSTLMQLMGLSSIGYLGAKYARKAGPNILELSIMPSTASTAGAPLIDAGSVDVTEPKAAAANTAGLLKKMSAGLTEASAPVAVREASGAVTALESAVAAAGAGGSSGLPEIIKLAEAAHNAAVNAAAEFDRMSATPGSEIARVSANIAQHAASAVQDLTESVSAAVAAAEAAAKLRATEEARLFRRVIEFRGSNLSAEGIFRAKIKPHEPGEAEEERDIPFSMLEEKNGVRAPIIVVPEENSGNVKFARTLRLEIVPAKLGKAEKETYDKVFGAPGRQVEFTIFNPDGQKATRSLEFPKDDGQRN